MRLIVLLAILLTLHRDGNAQPITIQRKNVSLQTVFNYLKSQTGYTFIFTYAAIQKAKPVTVDIKNGTLEEVLKQCFKEQPLTYIIINKLVVVKEKEETQPNKTQTREEEVKILLTGRTVSDRGEAIGGISIMIAGTNKGTSTGEDGGFSLEVPFNGTIVVSGVGYETRQIGVTSAAPLNIVLRSVSQTMDQVVVIGYGSQQRSDLTGSIASLDAATIQQSGVVSVDQVLQGRIAGLQMTQNTGLPGGSSSIQIRGLNSVNATNEPIYIIDGVIISSGTGSYNNNAFSAINPNDIETIDVLKDASATAIYGAQGANGVIIITTKKGKAGAPRIAVDARYGVQTMPKYLPLMNLQEYARHHNERSTLYGYGINPYFADPSVLSAGTNWQKEIFRAAAIHNYNISVSGGNEATTYRVSGSYMKQEGVGSGSGFNRITASVSLDTRIKPWARMGGVIALSRTKQVITIADWNLINAAVRQSPAVPVRNLDGSYGGPEDQNDQLSNPAALSKLLDKGNKKPGVRGNVYVEIKPTEALSLKTELANDVSQEMAHTFIPTFRLGARSNSEITNIQSQRFSNNWSWRNIAAYNQQFGVGHTLNALLGHELTERTFNFIYAKRLGGSNNLTDIDAGNPLSAENAGNTGRMAYSSLFGRVFYSFKSRYMITATLRYDGSSNFAERQKWGMFPSAALAWKISGEKFIKNIRSISHLKLRLGYGKVGNSNVRQFAYTANMANVPAIWGSGALVANVPNAGLTWERTGSYNLGLDLGLLNNRIELVADVYHKRTDNLLLELTLPGITGAQQNGPPGSASAPWDNVGSLQNRGFEFSLHTINIQQKNFSWNTDVIFTLNRNRIIRLNSEYAFISKTYNIAGGTYIVSRTEAGRSIGEYWGYKVTGRINSADDIYDKNGNQKIAIPEKQKIDERNGIWVGDLIWDDYNRDGVINEEDRQYLGSPLPKFTCGFGNTFSYKKLNLYIFFTGSYGNKVLNLLSIAINDPNATGNLTKRAGRDYAHLSLKDPNGSPADIYNVYVSGGNAKMPRMSVNDVNNNNRLSSRMVEDGSYWRLQNLSLTYTFTQPVFSKLGLNNLKVYVQAQNLFTITQYSGYDPEVGMTKDQYTNGGQNPLLNGIDAGRYPAPRIFTTGISLGL